jgi:DNA-binding MarR family transcriptional regulator
MLRHARRPQALALVRLAALNRRAFPRGGHSGLDNVSLQVLLLIAVTEDYSVGKLAETLELHETNVSRALGELRQQKLIRASKQPGDRRRRTWYATADGQRKILDILGREIRAADMDRLMKLL